MAKRERQDSVSVPGEFKVGEQQAPLRAAKYASVEPEVARTSAMRCYLPPHRPINFKTCDEYDTHYQQSHTNRCSECGKNLPTAHLLDLHISENHDPIVASKRDTGWKTYACFVEGCEKVCADWKKRRSHLVDKHAFPRNYDFFIVNSGIDRRRSMLRPGVDVEGHRKSSRERTSSSMTESSRSTEATSVSATTSEQAEEEAAVLNSQERGGRRAAPTTSSGIDELASSMSALNMVPRSISFGQRKGRSGFAKS